MAAGATLAEAISIAERDIAVLIEEIERVGLRVTPIKTEAMAFPSSAFRGRRRAPPQVYVGGMTVEVRCRLKYLGLTLDSDWTF
ncbi:hypothetical protein M0802_015535 [Mischocyttarus mexicanus]|nr:hypothetical protein M0802_015535 [Mischocyttarus mexicanus]